MSTEISTTYDTPSPEDTTREHRPVRVGYLVSGLVFLGLAVSWALWAGGAVSGPSLGYLLPSVLVIAGAAGIVALLVTAAQRRRSTPTALATDHAQTENDTEEIR